MISWPGLVLLIGGVAILLRARTFARIRIRNHRKRRSRVNRPDPEEVEPSALDVRLARVAGTVVAVVGAALLTHR